VPVNGAVVARVLSAGDVLITGPAVQAVAASHYGVAFLTGPRERAAAELLPEVDEIIEWRDDQYKPPPGAQLNKPEDVAAAAVFAPSQPPGCGVREMVVCASTESSWPP
jgi:hypothetical protein